MKKRSEKQQDLDQLKTALAKVSTVILTTFQGVKVEEDTKLRRAVQAAGGSYRVVKNTLAERATALAAVSRNLVVTLNEAVKADKFGAGGSGPDPVGTAQ